MCITRSRWIPRNSGTLISHALRSLSKCSSVFSLLKSRADISFYDVQSFRALFVFTFNVLGFFECAFGRVFDSDIFPCPYWFFRQEAQYSFHTSYYSGDFSSALKILPLLEQVSKLCPEKAWQVMMSRSLEAGLGDSCGATTKLQNCLRMSATPFSLQFQHLTVTSHLFFICFSPMAICQCLPSLPMPYLIIFVIWWLIIVSIICLRFTVRCSSWKLVG